MVLRFHEVCSRLRLTQLEVFETAYMYAFKKQGHVLPDYLNFIQGVELPKYVNKFIDHVLGEGNESNHVHSVRP